jgi:dTDP-4-amino-4,6-dideoxygalactose transaminase
VKTSDKINELAESLAAAQPKIGIAIKNAVNPHLKNRYADLGAVWDACSDALKSCGLAVVQMPQPSDDGKLHLETILIHKSGQWISGVAVVPIAKQDAQGYGANAYICPPLWFSRAAPASHKTMTTASELVQTRLNLKLWTGLKRSQHPKIWSRCDRHLNQHSEPTQTIIPFYRDCGQR